MDFSKSLLDEFNVEVESKTPIVNDYEVFSCFNTIRNHKSFARCNIVFNNTKIYSTNFHHLSSRLRM